MQVWAPLLSFCWSGEFEWVLTQCHNLLRSKFAPKSDRARLKELQIIQELHLRLYMLNLFTFLLQDCTEAWSVYHPAWQRLTPHRCYIWNVSIYLCFSEWVYHQYICNCSRCGTHHAFWVYARPLHSNGDTVQQNEEENHMVKRLVRDQTLAKSTQPKTQTPTL